MGRRVGLMVLVLTWLSCQAVAAASLKGVVTDSEGRALGGALVALTDPEVNSALRLVTARSAADGRFELALPDREDFADCELVATSNLGCGSKLAGHSGEVTIVIKPWAASSGKVESSDGKPLAGATVTVMQIGTDGEADACAWPEAPGWPALTAKTDANGLWKLEHGPAGGANLRVLLDGYCEGWTSVTPGQEADAEACRLDPAGAVAGRVTGADGKPVAGVQVMAFERGHVGIVATTRTDADGRYKLGGLGESAIAIGLLDGSGAVVAPSRQRVRVKAGTVTEGIDFAGTPGQVLAVTVVDAATGRPLPNVALGGSLPQGPLPEDPPIFTDVQGRVQLHTLPGSVYVSARPVGLWLDTADEIPEIEVAADKAPAPVTLRLERGQMVRGKLTDEAGAPIVGANLGVTVTAGGHYTQSDTNEDGSSTAGPLPRSGAVQITVTEGTGYERYNGEVKAAEINPLDWKLVLPVMPVADIKGRVVDSAGRPVAEANITLNSANEGQPNAATINPQTAASDEEGKFVFEKMPAAVTYQAAAAKEGYRFLRGGGQLSRGQAIALDDLVLQGLTGKVAGTVTDAAGKPVAGATVMALGYTDREATTDEKGAFAVAKLPPGPVRLLAVRGRQAASVASRTGEGKAALRLASLKAPTADDDRDLAEDALHTAWKDSAAIDWYERAAVPGIMARLDPAAAAAMLAEINAKDPKQADLLSNCLLASLREAPEAMLPSLKLADGLSPVRRAHLRLVTGLMLLDGPASAQAAALYDGTVLPAGVGRLTQATHGLLAARLGRAGGLEELRTALAGVDDDEARGMWAVGLAAFADARTDVLDLLCAKLPTEAGSLVRAAAAFGVSAIQPKAAAALLQSALAGGDLPLDEMPDLAIGMVRTALARTLAGLPAAEAEALVKALPADLATASQMLLAAGADAGEVEQRVATAARAGQSWALLPLAATVAPRAAKSWLATYDADKVSGYDEVQAVLRGRCLLDQIGRASCRERV